MKSTSTHAGRMWTWSWTDFYLLQWIAVLVAMQRGNAAAVLGTTPPPPPQQLWPNIYQIGNISIRMSTLPSVLLINYINLLLATVDAVGRLLVMQFGFVF